MKKMITEKEEVCSSCEEKIPPKVECYVHHEGGKSCVSCYEDYMRESI